MKKTKQEIKEWLLDNCVNELGNLDLNGLDFSGFEGDVMINEMKVKGNLHQSFQKVKGDLWQNFQEVEGNLWQKRHEVKGDLHQDEQKVGGK